MEGRKLVTAPSRRRTGWRFGNAWRRSDTRRRAEAPQTWPTPRVVERSGGPDGLDEGRRQSRYCGGDHSRRDPSKLAQHKNDNRRALMDLRLPGSGTDGCL